MRGHVVADLRLDLAVEGGPEVHAHLSGQGSALRMEVDDPAAFAGRRDSRMIGALAEMMAARGLVVHVVHDRTRLVSLGAVRVGWLQRRVTGSRWIRLGSLRGALAAARARARGADPVLPSTALFPPGTPWPPVPTLGRHRPLPGTTHDPARGGGARLVLVKSDTWDGERQPLFWLQDETSIGSDPVCDIVLSGLEPRHAVVRHDDEDEYVVHVLADPGSAPASVHGEPADGMALRTGARLDLGDHHLVFYREEFADHGRPYGGRSGGEAGRQRTQPRRQGGSGFGDWSG